MTAADAELEVERLLEAAATEPSGRPAFTEALLGSDVYVLGAFDGEIVDGVAQAGGSMRVVGLEDAEGAVTPFFTSEAALQRFVAQQPDTDPAFVKLQC